MYHLIEFSSSWVADVEVSPKHRLEQLRIKKGTRAKADVQPRVVETPQGFVEIADLYFSDGTVTRDVPFGHFAFVDE